MLRQLLLRLFMKKGLAVYSSAGSIFLRGRFRCRFLCGNLSCRPCRCPYSRSCGCGSYTMVWWAGLVWWAGCGALVAAGRGLAVGNNFRFAWADRGVSSCRPRALGGCRQRGCPGCKASMGLLVDQLFLGMASSPLASLCEHKMQCLSISPVYR